mmetsp:Transcript_24129/g.72521  ORF Transcript_24129/g.72521 Transcript_24129/m.72521 type:complete len:272 (-) Transcript_24129:276-1091(-)
MMSREKDMAKEWTARGSKPRILGYMSMGDRVPEVMTTDWKRSKTGFIAIEASLQQNWKSGSGRAGERSSYGSMMMQKPCLYVASSVAKSPTSSSGLKSETSVTCSVRSSERSRSATNLSGFGSMSSSCSSCERKASGVSCTTSSVCSRFLRCATSRFRKSTNESARRKLPGTACRRMSCGSSGFAANSSLALSAPLFARPCTRRWYSSLSRAASDSLSLEISRCTRERLAEAASSVGIRKLIDMTSMQMLSMLCASSKTTTHSRCIERETS